MNRVLNACLAAVLLACCASLAAAQEASIPSPFFVYGAQGAPPPAAVAGVIAQGRAGGVVQVPGAAVAPVVGTRPALRGFSITLVQGDTQASGGNDNVPAAAAKALADLKDFLPYKHYSLLDTQWTVGTGHIKSQLRRPDGQAYELAMVANPVPAFGPSPAGVSVSEFHLREAGASRSVSETAELQTYTSNMEAEVAQLKRHLAALQQQRTDEEGRKALEQQVADRTSDLEAARSKLAATNSIIDTSFRMDVGETVVVGTSRLQGDKALIVLLTAVGR
jgi:hypothetical protein